MSASPHGTDGHDLDMDVPETEPGVLDAEAPAAVLDDREVPADERPLRGRWLADALGARARLISALLAGSLAYVILDIVVEGPLTQLDIVLQRWDGEASTPELADAAWAYDKLGQRSVLVPILLVRRRASSPAGTAPGGRSCWRWCPSSCSTSSSAR